MNNDRKLELLEKEIINMEKAYLRVISYNEKLASHKEELDEEELSKYNELRARFLRRVNRSYYFVHNKLREFVNNKGVCIELK